MKRYRLHLLALFLLAVFSFAVSQNARENPAQHLPAVQTLDEKHWSETLNKQRLAQLMSAAGLRVDDTVNLSTAQAYLDLKLRLINKTNLSSSMEERQSNAVATTVLESQRHIGTLPRHRSIELSSDHLLMLTVSAGARLRWWSLITDPRILRSESPGSNGQLSGEVIYKDNVDFTVNIPDDSEAVELRFYHPRWTGESFVLVLIDTITLRH